MKLVGLNDAHILGYQSDRWWKQAAVWSAYVAVWIPLRKLGIKAWDRVTKERPQSFLARNMFRGDTYHAFVQGGSGFGKSSLLKQAVADHMDDFLAGRKSLFVMDDSMLIDEILTILDPTEEQIRERIILIDVEQAGGPGDIGALPRLALLNTGHGNAHDYVSMTAKSAILEMVFGSLLEGNETSGPMAAMLSFASKTIALCDNPGPEDFIRLLGDPHAFLEELHGVPKMVRQFWTDKCKRKPVKVDGEFSHFEPVPNPTADALATRVFQMISNEVVNRLLCNPVETVDLAKRLNGDGTGKGCMVFVATRSGSATSLGARHVGRFMLSMLLRAAMSRDELDEPVKTAAFVDEFPTYLASGVDESLLGLLSKARKKGMSINLFNQEEMQLHPKMISSLLANCGTLIAGGVSPTFAQRMSYPMGIKKIESGPDKGKPNVDLPNLRRRTFAASWSGSEPIIIGTVKDALGDKFTPLPKSKAARKKKITEVMSRCHRIMREMYAEDPVQVAIEDSENVVEMDEIRERMPI